jgi:hypothetical protein
MSIDKKEFRRLGYGNRLRLVVPVELLLRTLPEGTIVTVEQSGSEEARVWHHETRSRFWVSPEKVEAVDAPEPVQYEIS